MTQHSADHPIQHIGNTILGDDGRGSGAYAPTAAALASARNESRSLDNVVA